MKSSTSFGFSYLLLFFFIVAASINVLYSEDAATSIVANFETIGSCSYQLIVETGTVAEAGTDSIISVTVGNSAGKRLDIKYLEDFGTMLSSHDYFEKGNVDTFWVTTKYCFDTPVCNITVTSDGSGKKSGWFLESVMFATVNDHIPSHSTNINFEFRQWLANDEPPNKLTASRDNCQ